MSEAEQQPKVDTQDLNPEAVKTLLIKQMKEHQHDQHDNSKKWGHHVKEINKVLGACRGEANSMIKFANQVSNYISRLTFYFIQYDAEYKKETKAIEDLSGKNGLLTMRKAECAEQEAALEKCEVEQRQLRNDRNKEISAADTDNWALF